MFKPCLALAVLFQSLDHRRCMLLELNSSSLHIFICIHFRSTIHSLLESLTHNLVDCLDSLLDFSCPADSTIKYAISFPHCVISLSHLSPSPSSGSHYEILL